MCLNLNQLRDEENLEAKFFLPQKQLLLDDKDKVRITKPPTSKHPPLNPN